MNIAQQIVLGAALLAAGFAAGYPMGQTSGFSNGSEWALVQADLVARDAGLAMPVSYAEGQFRIVLKQPRHLYKRAWKQADRYEEEMVAVNQGERDLRDTVQLARNLVLVQ